MLLPKSISSMSPMLHHRRNGVAHAPFRKRSRYSFPARRRTPPACPSFCQRASSAWAGFSRASRADARVRRRPVAAAGSPTSWASAHPEQQLTTARNLKTPYGLSRRQWVSEEASHRCLLHLHQEHRCLTAIGWAEESHAVGPPTVAREQPRRWPSVQCGSGPEDGGDPGQDAPRGGRLNPVVVIDDRDADHHVARPVLDRQAQTRRNKYRVAA